MRKIDLNRGIKGLIVCKDGFIFAAEIKSLKENL